MTREDIKKQFPDATDEQISALLNINGFDVEEVKKKIIDPKLLKQLQEESAAYKKLQEAGLTDEEKIQKALKDAQDAQASFAKQVSKLEAEKILVAAGLTDEDYKDLIDGIVSEDSDATKGRANGIVALLNKKKEAAEKELKEKLMDGTQLPGGKGGKGGDEKSQAEKIAEKIYGDGGEKSDDILKNYL